MEILLWALGILVTIQLAVTGFLVNAIRNHEGECRQVTSRLSKAESDLEYFERQLDEIHDTIGRDSNSGMRGASHKRKGQVGMLALHIDLIREKVGMRAIDLAEAFRKDNE